MTTRNELPRILCPVCGSTWIEYRGAVGSDRHKTDSYKCNAGHTFSITTDRDLDRELQRHLQRDAIEQRNRRQSAGVSEGSTGVFPPIEPAMKDVGVIPESGHPLGENWWGHETVANDSVIFNQQSDGGKIAAWQNELGKFPLLGGMKPDGAMSVVKMDKNGHLLFTATTLKAGDRVTFILRERVPESEVEHLERTAESAFGVPVSIITGPIERVVIVNVDNDKGRDSVDEQFRSAADAIEFEKAKQVQEAFESIGKPLNANDWVRSWLESKIPSLGLTAMDVFAMAAMSALIPIGTLSNESHQVASLSYKYADQMLAEKKRREGK